MLIKPGRLKEGDTIGIVSPSSGIWKRSDMLRSIEEIESWGFKVKIGENAYNSRNYLAGNDQDRANDLMEFFTDDDIDAIFCSQGGYGAARILRYLDFDAIKSNPKIFIGYSDITSLHLAINKFSGLVTFHGPCALSAGTEDMTPYRFDSMMKALKSDKPVGQIKMSSNKKYLLKINGGKVEAPVIGGNLTLICSSLGTPYEIETEGKILFLEELDTEPWFIDHMLTHLINSGKLQQSVGIVVGECLNCEPLKYDPGFPNQCSLEDIIYDLLQPLGLPMLYGLPLGHTKDLATIPLGVAGTIDADKGVFEINEVATV